jgi:hypothetical protein
LLSHGVEPPIIEDEQLHAAERSQETGVTKIAAGEREAGYERLHRGEVAGRVVALIGR